MKYYVAVKFKDNNYELFFGKSEREEKNKIKLTFRNAMEYHGRDFKDFKIFTFESKYYISFKQFVFDKFYDFAHTRKNIRILNKQSEVIDATLEVLWILERVKPQLRKKLKVVGYEEN